MLVHGSCVFVYNELQGGIFIKKLIDCARSFHVINDLSKKSYKDKTAKYNACKSIATALERDGTFSV